MAPWWLLTTYFIHTVGELCLSPVGLSSVTKLAPRRLVGQMMGTFFMGNALGNLMTSNNAASTLNGGDGNDILVAGKGAGILTGGAGADIFQFDTLPNVAGRITDFKAGTDVLDLRGLLHSYTGSNPVADGYVSFNSDGVGGTQVFFDADGNGTNESSAPTDDPSLPGGADGTPLIVGDLLEVPTTSQIGLLLMGLLLAGAAWLVMRRS